jgi:hypothetical protein
MSALQVAETIEQLVKDGKAPEELLQAAKLLRSQAKRIESLDWVSMCAADVVGAWPKMTIRTIGDMKSRMDLLQEALKSSVPVPPTIADAD